MTENTIPATMRAYGPEHPDYPNAPGDWDRGPVQFRDGKVFGAPIGTVWKLGWSHAFGSGDVVAYTPKATAHPDTASGEARAEDFLRDRIPSDAAFWGDGEATTCDRGQMICWMAEFAAAEQSPRSGVAEREVVAQASAWLRQCSSWLLTTDLDMTCPMDADPLDIADDLDALLAQPDPAARLREALGDAIEFIEHMSSETDYPRDIYAREEFDDKLARYRQALQDTPA